MIKTLPSTIQFYLLCDYQKWKRFLFAHICVCITLFSTFSTKGLSQISDTSQSLKDSLTTTEIFTSLYKNNAKFQYEYLKNYNNYTSLRYTDNLLPRKSIYKNSSIPSGQILHNDATLDWNYFTAWHHSDMTIGHSPPGEAWTVLGAAGQTAIWGIIAAQAWNDGREFDFAAATAVTALSTYRSFNFLKKWGVGENVRVGVKPN